jgi:hypothetical protein
MLGFPLSLMSACDLMTPDLGRRVRLLRRRKCCTDIAHPRRNKYDNRWQCMKAPLAHLPDCQGVHYRLQLNVYKYSYAEHPDQSSSRA